jgi:3-hydroxybutyryl-CoA dehydrogenase
MAAINRDRKILVVGAGAMGAGIAQVAAAAGHEVGLWDLNAAAVATALSRIATDLERLVDRGKMNADDRDGILQRLHPTKTLADSTDVALVVEAVREDIEIKRRLFADLEAMLDRSAILTSNTSSLSITAIAAGLRHPDRFAGLHFFNPAPIMPLVEVVRGLCTSDITLETLCDSAKAWGKKPVVTGSTPGFIVNRVARPFYAEGLRVLLEQGAEPLELDAIMRDSGGFRMGPFELMDLIGHDVNFAVTSSIHAAYFGDPRYTPSNIQKELVDAGMFGRKSGRGFYTYGPSVQAGEAKVLPPSPAPMEITVRGTLDSAAAIDRLLAAAGMQVRKTPGHGDFLVDQVVIAACDGSTATARSRKLGVPNVVHFDLCLDWSRSSRVAISCSDQANAESLAIAAGLFQALGKSVIEMDDVPGMLVTRTLAMLVNEAADAVLHGVATAEDIDTAMQAGANYPLGLLAWADQFGPAKILTILDNLAETYGEDRYRASSLLRRIAAGSGYFHRASRPQTAEPVHD